MTQRAEILHLAPRQLIENEPTTTSTVQHVEVPSDVPADPTTEQQVRIVEVSGTLDFWLDEREDIYTDEDGEPA